MRFMINDKNGLRIDFIDKTINLQKVENGTIRTVCSWKADE